MMEGNVPGVDFRRKAIEGRRSIILQLGCFESSSCSIYLFNHNSSRRAQIPAVSQNEENAIAMDRHNHKRKA